MVTYVADVGPAERDEVPFLLRDVQRHFSCVASGAYDGPRSPDLTDEVVRLPLLSVHINTPMTIYVPRQPGLHDL